METQSYTISFFGLNPQFYTNATIGNVWNKAAVKVYQETGISITGEVHERYFVSPNITEEIYGGIIFMIESKKDVHEEINDQDYWNAYREVAKEARAILGNPRMNLTIATVNIIYFEKS
jgi:hypothetical protein